MRLRNALVPLVAIGLPLAACGEPQSTEEALVSGFDHTLVVDFEEKTWGHVTGASYPPNYSEDVRDVRPYQVEGDCVERTDPYYFDNGETITGDISDDPECWGDFWCGTEPGDPTHCEKEPDETKWEYDEKTWKNIGTCALKPRSYEMKYEEPRRDEDCIKVFEELGREGEHRSFEKHRFFVRVFILDDENKGHEAIVSVPLEVWSDIQRNDCIVVEGPKKRPEERSFVEVCEE